MKKRFNFSKAEKIGVAVLGLLIIIILAFINIPKQSFEANIFLTDTALVNYVEVPLSTPIKKHTSGNYSKQTISYKSFYPNSYNNTDWQKIGFTEKQSKVILKYRNQIGGFKTPEDLADCYVINEKKFNELKPYLKFEDKIKDAVDTVNSEQTQLVIELNSADQNQLETVYGIGPYFAKQIIDYGAKLGGYSQVKQVKEVYGMTEESYIRIQDQLGVDKTRIKKIDISSANFEQLRKHPYLNWKQCQIIVSMTEKKINEHFWSELIHSGVFVDSDIIKLKPYFK